MKKILIGVAALLAIALAVCATLWVTADPKLHRAVVAAEEAAAAGEAYDLSAAEAILADMPDQKLASELQALADRMIREGESPVPAAILAGRLTEAGRLAPEEAAAVAMLALAESPVSAKWPGAYQAALPQMLAPLAPQELVSVLVSAEFTAADARLQTTLGDLAGRRLTLEQIAEVYRARTDAMLAGDLLVKRALAPFTQEEVVAALAALEDAKLRAALARGYGKTLSQPDDVLNYLAEARAAGVSATDCYPGGAVVTMDLSRLWDVVPRGVQGESPRYIVVRMTEAAEALEYRDVPLELSMDEWDYDGAFTYDYESNDGRWAETVTVRIDTAMMDATPEEFLPSDMSEVGALVVLDTHYEAWGVLRVQEYRVKRATGGRMVDSYRDYRSYANVQRVDVYDVQGRLVYRFAEQVTEPAEMESRTDGFSDTATQEELRLSCIPVPDAVWMRERKSELEALLDACGGDLWQAIREHMKN